MAGNSECFDVVVVGGRCAGAPLATLLARAGLSVCVVDRARFPSDTPSTHAVQPCGVQVLQRLGVLPELLRLAPPIEHVMLGLGDTTVQHRGISHLLGAPMLNVRRGTLDAVLLDAAGRAGVNVRPATAVTGLLAERGRVTGVRTSRGALRAPLVVGADGARSTIARLIGAREYRRERGGRLFLWGYFEGGPAAGADGGTVWLGKRGDYGFIASPTDAGLFMGAVSVSAHRRSETLPRREAVFAAALAEWPELRAALAAARRVGPLRCMPDWHGYFRQSAGAGWALLGDAGHFKDPTAGQGIADALRQGERLAAAVQAGLDGSAPLDAVLRGWWAWRDRDAWPMSCFASSLGAPGPTPPVLAEIHRRLAADAGLRAALFRVLNHELAPGRLVPARVALSAAVSEMQGQRRYVPVLRELAILMAGELRPHLPATPQGYGRSRGGR